uniref:MHD domain-containing protein n=1 Tax=Periophthalmus magnuspinnatus TaxID=409849 RepID=A0A3B4BG86_9GOBI
MIHSLFLINNTGDIFLEKHWKSVISRSVCDYFFEAKAKAGDPENVPPVLQTPHHYLISVYRGKIFLLSVIQSEVPPLFVIEFLHRVADTIQDYFGECSENVIKDNLVIVYELLEEMLDNGFPLATESNVLKEMIRPPNILRSVVNTLTGTTVFAEIQGVIEACVRLSGMPDLTLSFMNPRLLDDVSFHPCVRFKRWEAERVLSFIPPDGNFTLMSYHVNSQNLVAIPVYVKQNINFFDSGSCGRLDITIGPKQTMGKMVESLSVTIPMPKTVLSANLTATQGSYTFDLATKILIWDVGKLNPQKLPNLKGTLSMQSGVPKPEENPSLSIGLKIQQLAISGLKVNRLDMYGEKYKPFKGVKYVTKAGKFQVRT